MNPVIENYQFLSGITEKMREAAAVGDWDHLVDLEKQCRQRVEIMKQLDTSPINEDTRQQKVALIKKILADDAAIRSKTEPWMAQLQRIVQSTHNEQQLQHAYSGEF